MVLLLVKGMKRTNSNPLSVNLISDSFKFMLGLKIRIKVRNCGNLRFFTKILTSEVHLNLRR